MMRREGLIIVSFLVVLFASQDVFSGKTPIELLVLKVAPDGWALIDAPETFTRETLFEHIDGQADLFLEYGFEKSVFTIYRNVNSSEDKIDVDIYDMGNPLQAFGVFSRFRHEESTAGIGLDSSLGDRYALFYKGKYFVVLQATDSNASTLKRLAQEIESRISDNSAPPKEIAYFPKSGLKPGSIEYFPYGLLGHQFLGRGFKASYVEKDETKTDAKTMSEGRDFHLFLSIFENSQEAMNALRLLREHLFKKGRVAEGISTQFGPDALTGVDPYQGKTIVAHKGPYLVGAVGFEQDKDGEQRLAELMNEVK
ncbi:MAG: hypothetical protein NTY51_15545 [Deltaproteobacteria bacterium]|nr:hypothetical protein [Deltaproteobacteria bacterium]